MNAVVSIHDVSPYFQREIDIIRKELQDIKKSYLITPLWNGEQSLNTSYFTAFEDEDLVLHGLTHKTSKRDFLGYLLSASMDSCKEFFGLNEAQTRMKIERALTIFEDIYRRKPVGFIPPMWYHNSHSVNVIKSLGFDYTESTTAFIDLRDNTRIFSIPACFDFGSNKLLSDASLFGWRKVFKHFDQSLVRISVHPSDVRNGYLPQIVELIKSLQSDNYILVRYADLIQR